MSRTPADAGSDPEGEPGAEPESEPGADPDVRDPAATGSGARHARQTSRRSRRSGHRVLWLCAAAVVIVVLAGVAWYEIEANPFGGQGRAIVVEVRTGQSTASVAAELAARGVVESALAFRLSMLIPGSPTIEPGGYLFHERSSFSSAKSVLSAGPDVFTLDVQAGETLTEVEMEVENLPGTISRSFVEAVRDKTVRSPYSPQGGDSLEGLIGVGTYRVLPGESGRRLLEDMTARFDAEASAAGVTPSAASALGVTSYQLVIVASIAQKEGYFDRYMGKVARVIYNRLADGMPLDMTSTVLYPLGQDGGTVTTADRQIDSPYNTYLHTGLTPTPICTPSPTALAAAVAPPPGSWLYFVVVSRAGTTLFTSTYQQQLANEKLARERGL